MQELKQELKVMIVETLKLEDVKAEEITDQDPLFREGLGLDSIDALELTVALEKKYKISIPDEEMGKRVLSSVEALALFVQENRKDLQPSGE